MEKTCLTPAQVLKAYGDAGAAKCRRKPFRTFLLAVLAGALIAFAAAGTNTAAHRAPDLGMTKLICGLLFPFGLGIVILMGAELFTGNSLIVLSVLDRKARAVDMLKNWVIVYIGNFAGALGVASAVAFTGLLDGSAGQLALFTMKTAAAKCALSFHSAFVLGLCCNVLVCLAVLCAMTAQDTTGKILGAFLPVALFVLCGFEHSVANMYYVPAGLFAKSIPAYAALAAQAGLNLTGLSWGSFFLGNLLPVTLGNIAGGAGIGLLLWAGHRK